MIRGVLAKNIFWRNETGLFNYFTKCYARILRSKPAFLWANSRQIAAFCWKDSGEENYEFRIRNWKEDILEAGLG
jgi:hypothetical protein